MNLYQFFLIAMPIIMTTGLALCLGRLPIFMLIPTIAAIIVGLLTQSAIIDAIVYFVLFAICLIYKFVRYRHLSYPPSRE